MTPLQNCLRMWEIWENLLLPKALNTCPKCKKSPNLITLRLHLPKLQQVFDIRFLETWCAAIAQWICLRLPFCRPRFKSLWNRKQPLYQMSDNHCPRSTISNYISRVTPDYKIACISTKDSRVNCLSDWPQ